MAIELQEKTGYCFRAKINPNGTVLVPAWARQMVEKTYGDEIDILVPTKQE